MGDNKLGILIQARIDEQSQESIQAQLQSLQKNLKSIKISMDLDDLKKQFSNLFGEVEKAQQKVTKSVNTTSATKQLSDYEKQIGTLIHSYKMGEEAAASFMEKMTALMYTMKESGSKTYTEGFSQLSYAQQEQAYSLLAQAEKQYTSTLTTESNNRNKIRDTEAKNTAKQEEDLLKLTTLQSKLNRQIADLRANYGAFDNNALDGVIQDVNKLGERTKYSSAEASNLEERLKAIQSQAIKLNRVTASSSNDGLISNLSSIGKKFAQYFLVGNVISTVRSGIHGMVSSVGDLDAALVEMKKVSDLTNEGLTQFSVNAFAIGDAVARTGTEVINAASAFARMGSSAKESLALAQTALIYANVGDNVSLDTATETLISTMKAFNIEAESSIQIIDKINEVSNNFAISSSGIGEGLQRSASSLMEANNSLDQTIALISVANTVTQDPITVSNGLKTISMRLRSVNEENGELIAGQRELFLELTNGRVDIMKNNEEFKSTYQIMKELGKEWEHLNGLQKSQLAQAAAGKTRANIFMSLMNSAEDLDKALDTSLNSMGSALKENEIAMESIAGKMNMLKSATESLFTNTMSSGFVKGLVDMATSIVQVIDKFGLLNTAIIATVTYLSFFKSPMWFAQGIGIMTNAIAGLTAGLGLSTAAAITLNTVLGMLAPIAIAAGIMGLVASFQKLYVSVEEQRDKVVALKEEYSSLTSELAQLKDISEPTQAEKDRITILEIEIAATQKLLEENEKLLAQKEVFGKGVWGKGVFGDTKQDTQDANTLITSIKAIQDEMRKLAEIDPVGNSDRILELNERYEKMKLNLTSLVPDLTQARKTLSDAIDKTTGKQKEELKSMVAMLDGMLPVIDELLNLTGATEQNTEATEENITAMEKYLALISEQKEKSKTLSDEYLELNEAIRSVSDGESVSLSQAKQIVEKYGLQYDAITEVKDGYVIELGALIELRDEKLKALQEMSDAENQHKNDAIAEIKARCAAIGLEISSYKQLLIAKQSVIKAMSATTTFMPPGRDKLFATALQSPGEALADKLQANKLMTELNVITQAIGDWDKVMQASTESSMAALDKLLSGDTGKKGSSSSSSKKSKSERFASYIEKGLDEDINAIKAKSAELEREIEMLNAKIKVAASKGNAEEELTFNKQLKEKLSEQKALLSTQANDLRGLKATMVKELQSYGYASLKGLDLSNITEKQMADIMRGYEVSIQAANLKGQSATEASLSNQKEQIKEFLDAIIKVNDEINNMSLDWWGLREQELEQQRAVIDRVYELENKLIDKKLEDAELEMLLLNENTAEYMLKERQKYDYVCERQALLLKQIKDYLDAGYKENSEHIEDLKKAYYDYETQRIEMAKTRAEKLKKIAEDELNSQISDLNSAKSDMNTLLNLVISMIKQETNDKKDALKEQLSDKKEALKESYEAQKESLKKEQENVAQMLEDEYSARKKALEDKLSLLKEEADRRKSALKEESDERSYQEDLNQATQKIADLENSLLDISMDNSVAGIKKRKELEAELAKAKKELDDLQYKHSIDMQEKAIDEELKLQEDAINKELSLTEDKNKTETESLKEKHEEELELIEERYNKELEKLEKLYNDEIKELEDFLKSEGKIREQAMKLLEDKSSALYDRLSKYAYNHTSMLESELQQAWDAGYEAMNKYGEGQTSILGIMENMIVKAKELANELKKVQDSTWEDYANKDNLEIGKDPNSNVSVESEQKELAASQRDKVLKQMVSNSSAWFGATKEEQSRLAKENEELAKQIGAWKSTTGTNAGKWFIKINDKAYEINDAIGVRHNGIESGFVGGQPLLKSNEEFNKLLKGELVINSDQMDTFMTSHLPNMLTQRGSDAGQNVVIEKLVDLQIDKVDATTLPQLRSMLKTEIPRVLDDVLSRNGIRARGVSIVR